MRAQAQQWLAASGDHRHIDDYPGRLYLTPHVAQDIRHFCVWLCRARIAEYACASSLGLSGSQMIGLIAARFKVAVDTVGADVSAPSANAIDL